MAERRMFTKRIIDSDAFLDMPLSTQSLYFHLNMRADDDGFLNNPRKIQRMIGASDDDLKLLVAKRFVLAFDNGVIVIKHWRMHNYIRKDRYSQTQYIEELTKLDIKEDGSYTEKREVLPIVNHVAAIGQPDGNQVATQYRLGKDRLGKESIDNIIISDSDEPEPAPKPKKEKPVKHKYGEYNNVLLTDEELQKLKTEYSDWAERIERLSSYVASTGKSYKSHYATIRNWARKDAETKPQGRKELVPDWMKKSQFHNIEQREYDYDSLEQQFINKVNQPTVGNNEELAERAARLREQFGAS